MLQSIPTSGAKRLCEQFSIFSYELHFYTIIMADSDRVVFPDEVADVKAAAADAKKDVGGETNSIETPPEEVTITSRNVIQVPSNCPEGYQRGPDGVCREVF